MFERVYGVENYDVAVNLNNLAALYIGQHKPEEAEPRYRQAMAIKEKLLGPDHPDVAMTLNNLGVLCKSEGRYEEAEALLSPRLPSSRELWPQTIRRSSLAAET